MLLPVFAVEPESLNTWPRMQLFSAMFGVEKGRLVSRAPKKWLQRACKAVYRGPAKEVERVRCVECLRALKEAMLVDDPEPWPQRESWVESVLERHKTRPFRAIVAEAGFPESPEVVPWDEVLDDHPRLRVDRGATIDRTPQAMADAVAPLLRVAREVVFVDRYFAPTDPRKVAPLIAFLERVAERTSLDRLDRVEYHTAIQGGDPSVFRKNCEQKLAGKLPPGVSLAVVLCDWAELHNRFVLTDRGGFQFGHGLDAPGGRDQVTILSESQWTEEWGKHKDRTPLCLIQGGPAGRP